MDIVAFLAGIMLLQTALLVWLATSVEAIKTQLSATEKLGSGGS